MSSTRSLAAVLVVIGLPVALVVAEAGVFYVSNRSNGTIVSSGQPREYLLHVPPSYVPGKPAPLVISMHGAAMWPAAQRDTSQWNRVADAAGVIVAYPSGTSGHGPRVWAVNRGPGPTADVRFISDLIDELKANYSIDAARVYADGLSNGGGMAFALSCELSDRIAAVGMVAAAHLLDWSWCKDLNPVPMIAFHGTADPVTPYQGGVTWVAPRLFPDIPTWTAKWAQRNRCESQPVESVVAADVTRREYPNCAEGSAVVLYTIQGGGHTWPGGGPLPQWFVGPTSTGLDATSHMWTFFRDHPLRTEPAAGLP